MNVGMAVSPEVLYRSKGSNCARSDIGIKAAFFRPTGAMGSESLGDRLSQLSRMEPSVGRLRTPTFVTRQD